MFLPIFKTCFFHLTANFHLLIFELQEMEEKFAKLDKRNNLKRAKSVLNFENFERIESLKICNMLRKGTHTWFSEDFLFFFTWKNKLFLNFIHGLVFAGQAFFGEDDILTVPYWINLSFLQFYIL